MPNDDISIRFNQSAIDELGFNDEAVDMLEDVGDQVADIARGLAWKDTGEGAESIHGEVGEDSGSAFVDVSWDREHFYMTFQEVGTEDRPASPFLRPALDQARI